jgi:hypothetical protein
MRSMGSLGIALSGKSEPFRDLYTISTVIEYGYLTDLLLLPYSFGSFVTHGTLHNSLSRGLSCSASSNLI